MKNLFYLLLITASTLVNAETIQGRTVGVADGDTITVLTSENKQIKVRFAQIDAPESSMPYGTKAKQSLSELVYGKTVTVQVQDTDRYQRKVGIVYQGNTDINLEQLKRGYAWFYTQYGTNPIYRSAEQIAKSQRLGLWADPNPVPPWEYRHDKKAPAKSLTSWFDQFKSPTTALTPAKNPPSSSCGSKRYCKEMTTCEEAKMYLSQCGLKSLDGNGDGVPCEKLCK